MSKGRIFVCTSEDFHPYECDGYMRGVGACKHCDRRVTADHDPATCPLCDPEYDHAPNRYRAPEASS